jgi:hypothetical protein
MLGFISNMQFACRKKKECRDEVIRRCHLYLTSFGYLVHRLPRRDGNAAGLKENLAGFVWSSRDHLGNWITRAVTIDRVRFLYRSSQGPHAYRACCVAVQEFCHPNCSAKTSRF